MQVVTLEQFVEVAEECVRFMKEQDCSYRSLAARYDDALKRINDLEAELEHLRREVNR